MKRANFNSFSLVAVAAVTCFSAVLLAGCGGGTSGVSSTPTLMAQNAAIRVSVFGPEGATTSLYECPNEVFYDVSRKQKPYLIYFKSIVLDTTKIPSDPLKSYSCWYASHETVPRSLGLKIDFDKPEVVESIHGRWSMAEGGICFHPAACYECFAHHAGDCKFRVQEVQ